MKAKILQEREERKKRISDRYSKENLDQLKKRFYGLFLFGCYVLLFLIIILSQLNIAETFHSNSMKEYITTLKFVLASDSYVVEPTTEAPTERNLQDTDTSGTDDLRTKKIFKMFKDIDTTSMIDQWRSEALFPVLYESLGSIIKKEDDITILTYNHVIGDPMLFLGVRKVKEYVNNDTNTNKVITNFTTGKHFGHYDKMGDEADTRVIDLTVTRDAEGDSSEDDSSDSRNLHEDEEGDGVHTVTYSKEGTGNSLFDSGGYVLSYPKDKEQAYNRDYWNKKNLLTENWMNLFFVFFSINVNTQTETANLVYFDRTPAGQIIPWYETSVKRAYFSSPFDIFRGFLEVIFVFMTCYYCYILLKDLTLYAIEKTRARLSKQPDNLKSLPMIVQVLEISSGYNDIQT